MYTHIYFVTWNLFRLWSEFQQCGIQKWHPLYHVLVCIIHLCVDICIHIYMQIPIYYHHHVYSFGYIVCDIYINIFLIRVGGGSWPLRTYSITILKPSCTMTRYVYMCNWHDIWIMDLYTFIYEFETFAYVYIYMNYVLYIRTYIIS